MVCGEELVALRPEEEVDFDGYEPSEPEDDDWLSKYDVEPQGFEQPPPEPDAIEQDDTGVFALSGDCPVDQPGPAAAIWSDEDLPEDREEIKKYVEDLAVPSDQVVLRYFVGLKSKSGADVAAGIQRMVLDINTRFPVRVLHTDPGTEFTSDSLKKWLLQQSIRLQHPLAADKQGNGLAERTIGWAKARARTLLGSAGVDVSLWPLAIRWAVNTHNRSVLGRPSLPYFGQRVMHKLKKPPGNTNELLPKWVMARYLAQHLTVPDGHVLLTEEGNLVGSRGFRDCRPGDFIRS